MCEKGVLGGVANLLEYEEGANWWLHFNKLMPQSQANCSLC